LQRLSYQRRLAYPPSSREGAKEPPSAIKHALDGGYFSSAPVKTPVFLHVSIKKADNVRILTLSAVDVK
jgi:hypothetical protein